MDRGEAFQFVSKHLEHFSLVDHRVSNVFYPSVSMSNVFYPNASMSNVFSPVYQGLVTALVCKFLPALSLQLSHTLAVVGKGLKFIYYPS